jgi:hypothetical protein
MPKRNTDLAPMPIVGYPDEVAMALRQQHRLGRLAGDPRTMPRHQMGDGRIAVEAVLRVPAPERPRDNPFHQVLAGLAFVSGLFLITGATVALTVWLAPRFALFAGLGISLACFVAALSYLPRKKKA